MSLNDKIANELNHFLKIITYKDDAEADESLSKSDKEKEIKTEIFEEEYRYQWRNRH